MKEDKLLRGYFPRILLNIILLISLLHPKISYAIKIVSLTPSITKQLISLGLKEEIIGCTSYCPIAQEKNSRVSIVGSISEINIESIMRINPDIVFANPLTDPKVINKLKKMKIRVEVFNYPRSINDIFKDFIKLGSISGKKTEAIKIVEESRNRLNKIKSKYKNYQKVKIFFVIGANPLFTAPKDTYIDDIIDIINGINIAKWLSNGMVSKEFVLKSDPDIFLIMDMGVVAKDVINDFKRYKFLSAVKKNNFFTVDADRLGSPSLPDLIDLIDNIGKMVYKS